MEEQKKEPSFDQIQNEFIEREFTYAFLQSKDKQIAYLTGMYYRKAVYKQQTVFGTKSLIKRLPITSKKITKDNIIRMLDDCNIVMRKIATKKEANFIVPFSRLRNKIFELLKQIENWESSPYELNIAFQMGYDAYIE